MISARLQDIIGKREIFLLGMIIYGVGDLIAALSPNAMVLDKNTKLCVLLVAVSIAAFLAFEIFELRYSEAGKIFELRYSEAGKAPLFDVRLLKNRNLRNGTLVRLITSFVMAGTLFALSVFLLSVLKLSAFETGLMLMPMTVGMMLAIALIML